MKIKKVLNNNFVVIDDNGDKIYGGKGLGFGKKPGDFVDQDKVNQKFVISHDEDIERISAYLDVLNNDLIQIGLDILELAKLKCGCDFNSTVAISIADHISSSIDRYNEGIIIPNYMLWEIKKFYTVEYEIGLYAIDMVSQILNIKLPEDEAGFIATHIIDAQLENSNLDQIYKTADLIKEISKVVKYHFNVEFDNDSIYYYRFVTHLKFFAQRLFNDYTFNDDEDSRLYDIIQVSYVNSFTCSQKISELLEQNYSYSLSKEEMVYLTIHIENVIYKSKK